MNILIADDEPEIIELIELYLTKEDYVIYSAQNGLDAAKIISKQEIDLAVVDIMMPGLNGLDLVKKIRSSLNIPVIIISARGDFSDKILGLEIGADDYVAKPFNPLELVARIKAQLRRYNQLGGDPDASASAPVLIGELSINTEECLVLKRNVQVDLTTTEYRILECLLQQPGRVYTKKQIYEFAWGENYYGDENVMRIHISNLRDKVEDDPKNPVYIKTIRGLGYKVEKL